MNLFDRFAIGGLSAFLALATGFFLSFIPVMFGATLDLMGPVFKLSILFSCVFFVLGFIGKSDLVIKILTVPWKALDDWSKR